MSTPPGLAPPQQPGKQPGAAAAQPVGPPPVQPVPLSSPTTYAEPTTKYPIKLMDNVKRPQARAALLPLLSVTELMQLHHAVASMPNPADKISDVFYEIPTVYGVTMHKTEKLTNYVQDVLGRAKGASAPTLPTLKWALQPLARFMPSLVAKMCQEPTLDAVRDYFRRQTVRVVDNGTKREWKTIRLHDFFIVVLCVREAPALKAVLDAQAWLLQNPPAAPVGGAGGTSSNSSSAPIDGTNPHKQALLSARGAPTSAPTNGGAPSPTAAGASAATQHQQQPTLGQPPASLATGGSTLPQQQQQTASSTNNGMATLPTGESAGFVDLASTQLPWQPVLTQAFPNLSGVRERYNASYRPPEVPIPATSAADGFPAPVRAVDAQLPPAPTNPGLAASGEQITSVGGDRMTLADARSEQQPASKTSDTLVGDTPTSMDLGGTPPDAPSMTDGLVSSAAEDSTDSAKPQQQEMPDPYGLLDSLAPPALPQPTAGLPQGGVAFTSDPSAYAPPIREREQLAASDTSLPFDGTGPHSRPLMTGSTGVAPTLEAASSTVMPPVSTSGPNPAGPSERKPKKPTNTQALFDNDPVDLPPEEVPPGTANPEPSGPLSKATASDDLVGLMSEQLANMIKVQTLKDEFRKEAVAQGYGFETWASANFGATFPNGALVLQSSDIFYNRDEITFSQYFDVVDRIAGTTPYNGLFKSTVYKAYQQRWKQQYDEKAGKRAKYLQDATMVDTVDRRNRFNDEYLQPYTLHRLHYEAKFSLHTPMTVVPDMMLKNEHLKADIRTLYVEFGSARTFDVIKQIAADFGFYVKQDQASQKYTVDLDKQGGLQFKYNSEKRALNFLNAVPANGDILKSRIDYCATQIRRLRMVDLIKQDSVVTDYTEAEAAFRLMGLSDADFRYVLDTYIISRHYTPLDVMLSGDDRYERVRQKLTVIKPVNEGKTKLDTAAFQAFERIVNSPNDFKFVQPWTMLKTIPFYDLEISGEKVRYISTEDAEHVYTKVAELEGDVGTIRQQVTSADASVKVVEDSEEYTQEHLTLLLKNDITGSTATRQNAFAQAAELSGFTSAMDIVNLAPGKNVPNRVDSISKTLVGLNPIIEKLERTMPTLVANVTKVVTADKSYTQRLDAQEYRIFMDALTDETTIGNMKHKLPKTTKQRLREKLEYLIDTLIGTTNPEVQLTKKGSLIEFGTVVLGSFYTTIEEKDALVTKIEEALFPLLKESEREATIRTLHPSFDEAHVRARVASLLGAVPTLPALPQNDPTDLAMTGGFLLPAAQQSGAATAAAFSDDLMQPSVEQSAAAAGNMFTDEELGFTEQVADTGLSEEKLQAFEALTQDDPPAAAASGNGPAPSQQAAQQNAAAAGNLFTDEEPRDSEQVAARGDEEIRDLGEWGQKLHNHLTHGNVLTEEQIDDILNHLDIDNGDRQEDINELDGWLLEDDSDNIEAVLREVWGGPPAAAASDNGLAPSQPPPAEQGGTAAKGDSDAGAVYGQFETRLRTYIGVDTSSTMTFTWNEVQSLVKRIGLSQQGVKLDGPLAKELLKKWYDDNKGTPAVEIALSVALDPNRPLSTKNAAKSPAQASPAALQQTQSQGPPSPAGSTASTKTRLSTKGAAAGGMSPRAPSAPFEKGDIVRKAGKASSLTSGIDYEVEEVKYTDGKWKVKVKGAKLMGADNFMKK